MYSTVTTSLQGGASVRGRVAVGVVGDGAGYGSVEVASLLGEIFAEGNLDHAPPLHDLGPQQSYQTLPPEAHPHPLQRAADRGSGRGPAHQPASS